jgi:hypothetical protein
VEPRFDAEITFAEITDDGMVRHPVFKALLPSASFSPVASELRYVRTDNPEQRTAPLWT